MKGWEAKNAGLADEEEGEEQSVEAGLAPGTMADRDSLALDMSHPLPEQPQEPVRRRKDDSPTKQRGSIFWLLLIILVIGAAGVMLYFFFLSKKSSDRDQKDVPVENTFEQTEEGTSRLDRLRELLEPVSGQELLLDTSTPQYDALVWLTNEDAMRLDLDNTAIRTIYERYIAALLYYHFKGDGWRKTFNFLSATPVCEWNDGEEGESFEGIKCGDDNDYISEVILYMNRLEGSIPAELSLLNLQTLGLGANRGIVGSIPSEIGDIGSLEWLHLGGNSLVGNVPSQFASLSKLKALILYGNELDGEIPSGLGGLQSLETIFLEGNRFTGDLNSIFCEDRASENPFETFYADCGGEFPETYCPCCTHCCDQDGIACTEDVGIIPVN